MMITFDITNKKKAMETLAKYLQINISVIEEYIEKHIVDYDAVLFLNSLNIELKQLSLKEVELIGMHLTSNDDECSNLKKYGLKDLYHVLQYKNDLTDFFNEHGILFDLTNKMIKYQERQESLEQSKFDLIRNKIYDNSVIYNFLRIGDFGYYSAKLQIRPEILTMLSSIYDDEALASFWDLNHETYLVKFKEKAENFDWYSLADSGQEQDVILQLIYYALDVIALNEHVEISCNLKKGYCVPPENILDIHHFYNN